MDLRGRLVINLLSGLVVVCTGFLSETAVSAQTPDSVGMVLPDGDGLKYWPRWRGPSGQGLVYGDNYPDKWSETENVIWKINVPGSGHSSPIVWADRIFLTTARQNGRRVSLLSFQRSDGTLLWETDIPVDRPERTHSKNTPASATPTTDGERVYASFGDQGLVAVDFDGNLVWHHKWGTISNYHGTASSPLLYKDRVIAHQDQRQNSFVAAFDKLTGALLWKTARSARIGWGSPVIIRVGDHDELIVSGGSRVYSYDTNSGEELWTCGGNQFEVVPTPVVGHGLVFCSSGRSGSTLAIKPGGNGDVTDTHLVWKNNRGSSYVPSPLVYGNYLYMVNDMASIVTCYEATTGALMWQGRLGRARRTGFSASPIGMGGKVFFTNDSGDTFVLEAGPEFNLLHINQLNSRTFASPALVDGQWYFRTEHELVAIGNQVETF